MRSGKETCVPPDGSGQEAGDQLTAAMAPVVHDEKAAVLCRHHDEKDTVRRRHVTSPRSDEQNDRSSESSQDEEEELTDVEERPKLARLLSVPLDKAEVALLKAEEIAEDALLKAEEMAGDALHKAEEMAGDALHKAEEMAGDALHKAEEMAGDALHKAASALHKAEEMAHKAEEMAGDAMDKAKAIAKGVWDVVHHHHLPPWLQDNNFLLYGHRPPLPSFKACFKSIFRIHTETGNIWTHMLGCVAFVCVSWYFLTKPSGEMDWQEKAVFSAFLMGAICCLGFSFTFHTCVCHSPRVGRIFSKLDYCGISLLTMGSFVPWLYYSFYCRIHCQIIYNLLIVILGIASIVFSMWDKFAEPKFRPVRAGTFIALGLSGVIPAVHFVVTDGLWEAINFAGLGWLILMAFLYIFGAIIYACRIPERFWPGKFDIWFQSHQIFHVFVVAAAFVHLHGVSGIASYRMSLGDCRGCGQVYAALEEITS